MKRLFSVVLLVVWGGCRGPDAQPIAPDQGLADQDMAAPADIAKDLSDVRDLESDGDMDTPACQPLAQCPANTCGMVDDGCGGQLECGGSKSCEQQGVACGLAEDGCGGVLDCGPCLCQNGVPVVEQCGVEGQGQVVCDTPAGRCQLPQTPQGPANFADPASYATVLYVYPRVGRLDQIQAAIDQAAMLPKPALVALMTDPNGYQHFSHSLTLRDQVSVVAGFTQEGQESTSNSTRDRVYVIPTLDEVNKRFTYVNASNITTPTWLSHMFWTSAKAVPSDPDGRPDDYVAPAGYDGYGMWIEKSPGLRLESVTINQQVFSENYPRSLSPPPPQVGPLPLTSPPTEYWLEYDEVQQRWEAKGTPPTSQPSINPNCPQVQGGAGGLGAFAQGMSSPMIVPAQSGQAGNGGALGGVGATMSTLAQNGQDAPRALDVVPTDGAPVLVTPDPIYVPGRGIVIPPEGYGQDGQDGAHGQGGGGGGGGYAQLRVVTGKQVWIPGATGNPGYPGGCGGRGGKGGRPGVNRVGMLIVDSQGIRLNQVHVAPFFGGQGEDGEQGQSGQLPATNSSVPAQKNAIVRGILVSLNVTLAEGGQGGYGAAGPMSMNTGESGGSGSGGVGGNSFGLFCVNTILAPSLASFSGTLEPHLPSLGGCVFSDRTKCSSPGLGLKHWGCFPR